VDLQPAGAAIVERFVAITARKHESLLERFTTAEKEQLLDLLSRVVLLTLAGEERTDAICLQCYSRRGEDCIIRELHGDCLHNREH
jgi:hypothetical protein